MHDWSERVLVQVHVCILEYNTQKYDHVFVFYTAEDKDGEIESWAIKACQRCLIFLGDIGKKV